MKRSIFINVGKRNAPTREYLMLHVPSYTVYMIDNLPKKNVVVQAVRNPAVTNTRQQLSPYSI